MTLASEDSPPISSIDWSMSPTVDKCFRAGASGICIFTLSSVQSTVIILMGSVEDELELMLFLRATTYNN